MLISLLPLADPSRRGSVGMCERWPCAQQQAVACTGLLGCGLHHPGGEGSSFKIVVDSPSIECQSLF